MSSHYVKLISNIQKSSLKLKLLPTIIVYALIYLGWYYFIYSKNTQLKIKLRDSFVLGLVIYVFMNLLIRLFLINGPLKQLL